MIKVTPESGNIDTSSAQTKSNGQSYLLNEPIKDSVNFGAAKKETKKKSHVWGWVLGIGAVLAAIVVASRSHGKTNPSALKNVTKTNGKTNNSVKGKHKGNKKKSHKKHKNWDKPFKNNSAGINQNSWRNPRLPHEKRLLLKQIEGASVLEKYSKDYSVDVKFPKKINKMKAKDFKNPDTLELFKKAYRQLVTKFHPDKNPDDAVAKQHFQKISEAYEFITKPEHNFR